MVNNLQRRCTLTSKRIYLSSQRPYNIDRVMDVYEHMEWQYTSTERRDGAEREGGSLALH